MKKITLILTLAFCLGFSSKAQMSNNLLFVNYFTSTAQQQTIATDKIANSNDDGTPKFILNGNKLTAKNIEVGTQIDIYSVLGAKVHSFIYNGEPVILNLNRGIYIAKANRYTQKLLLQ